MPRAPHVLPSIAHLLLHAARGATHLIPGVLGLLMVTTFIQPFTWLEVIVTLTALCLWAGCWLFVRATQYATRIMVRDGRLEAVQHASTTILAHLLVDAGMMDAHGKGSLRMPQGVLECDHHGLSWPHLLTDEPRQRRYVHTAWGLAVRATLSGPWARWVAYHALRNGPVFTLKFSAPTAHQRLAANALIQRARA